MPEIKISIAAQQLIYFSDDSTTRLYRISSSSKGTGQRLDSGRTPLGHHVIRAKVGGGLPAGTVFTGRRPTGEIFRREMLDEFPDRDWILTRIMWLCGKQPGYNRFGNVDTMKRYIYIHGTPYEDSLGQPVSHGCIRMSNRDVIELYSLVDTGCPVIIREQFNDD